MARKLALMAMETDLDVTLIRPRFPRSSQPRRFGPAPELGDLKYRIVPMLGATSDPHRVLYQTMDFALGRLKPDIIHVEEEPDSLVSLQVALVRRMLAPDAKLILHTWQNINRPKAWHVRWVIERSLSAADAILCANRESGEVLRQMGYRDRTEVIAPQGVDITHFRPAETNGDRTNGKALNLLFVGRLVPEKGLDILIAAVRKLSHPFKLRIVGDGPLRDEIERMLREGGLGDCIEMISWVPQEQLPAFYQAADVLILPSRTTPIWKEQFGRVLIEAMACKVAVVGSNSGAIPEVLGESNIIFPEGDANALAECLSKLYDFRRRSELAERGFQRAIEHYSQERLAQQTGAFYRRLLNKQAWMANQGVKQE
jgi:glycosyltransferase involved in cell wall biosynthesis